MHQNQRHAHTRIHRQNGLLGIIPMILISSFDESFQHFFPSFKKKQSLLFTDVICLKLAAPALQFLLPQAIWKMFMQVNLH